MIFDFVFCFVLLIAASFYFIMILAITAGLLKKRTKRSAGHDGSGYFSQAQREPKIKELEKVTVILPVRNEFAVITNCLDNIALQDYPKDLFEIIVSDDFSEDYTVEKVRRWIKNHPEVRLTLVEGSVNRKENQGKMKAIERAVAIAEGELIITTDADTIRGKSWIRSIAGAFINKEVRMVLGPVGFTGEKGMFQKIQVLEFSGIMGVTAGSANLGYPLMCNGANLAYRKQAFNEAGGYSFNKDFHSGDDQFLMMNFTKKFGKKSVVFLNEKDAIVLTSPCASWHDFREQRLRWVSKSRGYSDRRVIAAGLLTIGFPLLILLGGIAGIFNPLILVLSSFLWFLKILIEYPLVWLMARFFEKKQLLNYYFAAQAFQFYYSIYVSIGGQFSMYSWKGRRFRK